MVNQAEVSQTSKLYSWIGIAAADKVANSISLKVTIPELSPSLTGPIGAATSTQAVQLTDLNGGTQNSTVTTTNAITAEYIGNTSNRKYPPDVVKGEQVRVTKFANADKYYWESMGRNDAMRTTETLRHEVTNRKNFADPADDDHTYSWELDSKVNQHIRLLTSKGNGEAYIYTLLLDAKNSKVMLSDNIGNALTIDSANAKVIVQNSKNAFVMLNGLDVLIGSPRDLTIKATRQMLIDSPLITIANQSGSGVLAILSNAIAVAATSAMVVTAPAIGLNGAVKVPQILTANVIRAMLYTNGPVGAPYAPASISLTGASATAGLAGPDTMVPASQRHAASWEQVTAAMDVVVGCFNEIQAAIDVPTAQTTIMPIVATSVMPVLQGT